VAQTEIVALGRALAESAKLARADIPRDWPNTAARMAASSLRVLFSHHGLHFSATVSEYGKKSDAVAALIKVAHLAGDKMKLDAARKWIEFAIHEHEEREKARETVNQKTGEC